MVLVGLLWRPEIPVDITRALASSPSLHNKRDLIEDFVRSVSSTGDVAAQWEAHIKIGRAHV